MVLPMEVYSNHSLCRVNARQAILWLCKCAMRSKTSEPCLDWLFVLPLCDFLSGDAEPFFSSLEYRPTLFSSGRAEEFGYKGLHISNQFKPGYVYYN